MRSANFAFIPEICANIFYLYVIHRLIPTFQRAKHTGQVKDSEIFKVKFSFAVTLWAHGASNPKINQLMNQRSLLKILLLALVIGVIALVWPAPVNADSTATCKDTLEADAEMDNGTSRLLWESLPNQFFSRF